MKKLARMFYGRTAAYGDALDRGDDEALARGACAQRPSGRPTHGRKRPALAAYVIAGATERWPGSDSSRDLQRLD